MPLVDGAALNKIPPLSSLSPLSSLCRRGNEFGRRPSDDTVVVDVFEVCRLVSPMKFSAVSIKSSVDTIRVMSFNSLSLVSQAQGVMW